MMVTKLHCNDGDKVLGEYTAMMVTKFLVSTLQ